MRKRHVWTSVVIAIPTELPTLLKQLLVFNLKLLLVVNGTYLYAVQTDVYHTFKNKSQRFKK